MTNVCPDMAFYGDYRAPCCGFNPYKDWFGTGVPLFTTVLDDACSSSFS